mgnify:CR=1 FL=1
MIQRVEEAKQALSAGEQKRTAGDGSDLETKSKDVMSELCVLTCKLGVGYTVLVDPEGFDNTVASVFTAADHPVVQLAERYQASSPRTVSSKIDTHNARLRNEQSSKWIGVLGPVGPHADVGFSFNPLCVPLKSSSPGAAPWLFTVKPNVLWSGPVAVPSQDWPHWYRPFPRTC